MRTRSVSTAVPRVHRPSALPTKGPWSGKQPFLWGLAGGALLWGAFPPLGWSWLGWLATLPWIVLAMRPTLPGKHPYRQLFFAGVVTWLALLQWVRLPHWATGFGWIALSLYLACYLPVFVAVTRHMVHRWLLPVWIAAPVVWTGLELARARLATGFAMLLLGHTQVHNLTWIQIADLGGAYAVSFLMVAGAAAIANWISGEPRKYAVAGTIVVAMAAASAWSYGAWRVSQWTDAMSRASVEANGLRIGLVQGSIDTRFDDPNPPRASYETYLQLSRDALAAHPDLQLLIWPESMYWQYDEPFPTYLTLESDPSEYHQAVAAMGGPTAAATVRILRVPCFVGCAVYDYDGEQQCRYNSILMIDGHGRRAGRYDKMHPVMFGEYIPLGDVFPWLYAWTPMGAGLSAGSDPVCFDVEGIQFCPNICFENTVPHLIRRQVRAMIAKGESPDVLMTATNDGWFWGSSLLDHHLACGVFRAIEMRRPMLIAANTGFSAWIESSGQIRGQGPRRADGLVVAQVWPRAGRESVYLRWGDLPAAICLAWAAVAAADGMRLRRWPRNVGTRNAPSIA